MSECSCRTRAKPATINGQPNERTHLTGAIRGRANNPWKRWLSLGAYGLVTSALFGAATPPVAIRARFKRLSSNPRARLRRKFPNLVFGDHSGDRLPIESACAAKSSTRVIFYLHGGVFFTGSPASCYKQTMRLSYRFDEEVFGPAYRLRPKHPYTAALDDALAAWYYPCTVDTPNMDKTSCDKTHPLSVRRIIVCIAFNYGHAPFPFRFRECCFVTAASAA